MILHFGKDISLVDVSAIIIMMVILSPWFTTFSKCLLFGKVSLYMKNINKVGDILIKGNGPTIISRVLLYVILVFLA